MPIAEQGERNVEAESSRSIRSARYGRAVADDPNDADACREAALRLLGCGSALRPVRCVNDCLAKGMTKKSSMRSLNASSVCN